MLREARALTGRPVAWLLAGPRLPVTSPTAAELRLERLRDWLADFGYEPVVVRPGGRGWPAAIQAAALTPWLALLALRRRPALVLANTPAFAPALAVVKLVLGRRVRTIADVMGLHSLELEQATPNRRLRAVYRPVWRILEALLFRAADVVLTVNARHAALVSRSGHANVHVLRDAADAALVSGPASDRAAFGLPPDATVVGYVGSLVYGRLKPLLAAWDELAADGLWLLVIGDGPDRYRYDRVALERGWLGTSIVFAGALSPGRALGALGACDIAYSDCWSEAGFPAKLFDYMALALPIVADGKPQLAEVLTDGEDALLPDPGAGPAAALRRLAGDPGLRSELGRRARATFLDGHTTAHRRAELAGLLGVEVPSDPPASPAPGEADRARPAPRFVSVVVPVLDAAATLGRQLDSIAAQDYDGAWEVVIADNGSTDGSRELAVRWAESRDNARTVDAATRRGPGHARNRGVRDAHGDFLAFLDADDAAEPDWLRELARAARMADLVGGRLNDRPRLGLAIDYRAFSSTGNLGIWSDVFHELGGFDEDLPVGEDIDLSWRAQLAGHRLAFAPAAVVRRFEREGLIALARQQHSYGAAHAALYRRFAASGLPRPSLLVAAAAWAVLGLRLPAALVSRGQRRRWVTDAAVRWGRVTGSVRNRVVFL